MNGILSYDFMVNALLASILGAVTAGIVGTYIVTRRMVFITGGITHASFGGLGLAYFLGLNPMLGAGVFAVASALGIEWMNQKRHLREDSLIAIAWSLGMAIGVIFIFMSPGYAPNLMSYLFGNILSVSTADLAIMAVLMTVVLVFFTLFFRAIQYITFDENFARTSGISVELFKYLLMGLVAVTAVIYIRVAGIILVLSMLTVPQNTAMILTNKLKPIILLSILFSLAGSMAGLSISYFWNIPSGASIIFSLIMLYIIISAVKPLWRKSVKS